MMTEIKIMPDWGCYPLWMNDPEDDCFRNIPADDLGLSDGLKRRLEKWYCIYEQTLNWDVPQDSGFKSVAEEDFFEKEGLEIWRMLIDEAGPGYLVSYYSQKENVLLYPEKG